MKPENWIGIAQIVITIIGMAVGPWIAVRLSIRQFRSTKSWEKATEAYSEILKQLAVVSYTNRRYYEHFLNTVRMEKEERDELSAEYRMALKSLERMSIANSLFISGIASKAITLLIESIENDNARDVIESLDTESHAIKDCIVTVTCEAPKQRVV
jgi:hypothetical protein